MDKKKEAKQELTVTEFARLGGFARSKRMTKEQRAASARKAAQARWGKEKHGSK